MIAPEIRENMTVRGLTSISLIATLLPALKG
jgi:hypothetical protein